MKKGIALLDELIAELEKTAAPSKGFPKEAFYGCDSGFSKLTRVIEEMEEYQRHNAHLVTDSAPVVDVPVQKAPKQSKPKKDSKPAAQTAAAPTAITVNSLDLRVGKIVSVSRHETADKLYCEMIDVGEETPRAIASGLVPHYTLEEMQDRRVIVVCNLKARNLVGFKSHGMVLCSAQKMEDGSEKVEFIDPPAHAGIGSRVHVPSIAQDPLSPNQCDKQKAFEVVAASLRVNDVGEAVWENHVLCAEGVACTSPSLRNCCIR